jgi:hypothetical protein
LVIITAFCIAAGAFVSEFIAPFSGPLEVSFKNNYGSNSTFYGSSENLYNFRVNGVDLTVPPLYRTTSTSLKWNSDQLIELEVIPSFIEESPRAFYFSMRENGFTGSERGSVIRLEINITDTFIDVFFKKTGSTEEPEWQVLASDRMVRADFSKAINYCIAAYENPMQTPKKISRNIYPQYESAVKKANLDGQIALPWTSWAFRSEEVQISLQKLEDGLKNQEPPHHSERWASLVRSMAQLRLSWQNLEGVARAEDNSRWEKAWDRIFSGESTLSTAAMLFDTAPSNGKSFCTDSLTTN